MSFKLFGQHFVVRPNWKVALFYILMMPVLLSLGYWQLHRAEEKTVLLNAYEKRQQAEPLSPDELDRQTELDYLKVRIRGYYDSEHSYLLDNSTYQGRAGYSVITAFELSTPFGFNLPDGTTRQVHLVWIDRGWLAMGANRQSLPAVPPVGGQQELVAQINTHAGERFLLADTPLSGPWPVVMQTVDISDMSRYAGAQYEGREFPYLLRLAQGQPGALQPIWQPVNMGPEKHLGYALQWFSMSAALTILYLFVTVRREKEF